MKVKVVQLCRTLCNPMDYIVPGILQPRILDWVAFPFSREFSQPRVELRSPSLQVDSLLDEPQGNCGMLLTGSFSLLKVSSCDNTIILLMKKHWPIHSILEERKETVSYIVFSV